MNDELKSPILISHLFDAIHTINQIADRQTTISAEALTALRQIFQVFVFDILGLQAESSGSSTRDVAFGAAIDLLLQIRGEAKAKKDWATSDKIRDELARLGFEVKDTKEGPTWKLDV